MSIFKFAMPAAQSPTEGNTDVVTAASESD